jgi:hypothetical protein
MPAAERRLPRWPEAVGEAMDKEMKLGLDLVRMMGRQGRMSAEDRKQLLATAAERTKAFQALRWTDYVQAVAAMETIVKRYADQKPQ